MGEHFLLLPVLLVVSASYSSSALVTVSFSALPLIHLQLKCSAVNLSIVNVTLAVFNFVLSSFNFSLSAVNFLLSAVNFVLSFFSFSLAAVNFLLSSFNFSLSAVNFLLSSFNFSLSSFNFCKFGSGWLISIAASGSGTSSSSSSSSDVSPKKRVQLSIGGVAWKMRVTLLTIFGNNISSSLATTTISPYFAYLIKLLEKLFNKNNPKKNRSGAIVLFRKLTFSTGFTDICLFKRLFQAGLNLPHRLFEDVPDS